MQRVLVINSSINGPQGNSSKLAAGFINQWQQNEQLDVREIDLAATDLPHLTQQEMQAWMIAAEQRSEEYKALAAISDKFIEDLKWADSVIVGMPMYNFSMPSVFKAWIDRVTRAGITFKYTEQGPVGLLENKRLVVLAARGGIYAGTDKDTQTPYLKNLFAFIGIQDIEFVYAEGLAMGEENVKKAWQAAEQKNVELIEKWLA